MNTEFSLENKTAVSTDIIVSTVEEAQIGGGNPGGSDTQVQFNDSGSFGGSSNVTFDGTNLSIVAPTSNLHAATKLYVDSATPATPNLQTVTDEGSTTTNTITTNGLTTTSNDIKYKLIPWNGSGTSKFRLSSTWVVYGDSYSDSLDGTWGANGDQPAVTLWPSLLATTTSTTVINKAVGGTTMDFGSKGAYTSVDSVTTAAYANYHSILMYGINDISRGTEALYSDTQSWVYSSMCLGVFLTHCVPQANIVNARDMTVVAGTWANTGDFSTFGVNTTNINAQLRFTATGRYVAIRWTNVATQIGANLEKWEIHADGDVVSWVEQAYLANATYTLRDSIPNADYYSYATIIDLGSAASRQIDIFNRGTNGISRFIDFAVSWNANDANARDLLVCSFPFWNQNLDGTNATPQKWMQTNKVIKDTVTALQRYGLPVYHHETTWSTNCWLYDNSLHWNQSNMNRHAQDIIDLSITEILS